MKQGRMGVAALLAALVSTAGWAQRPGDIEVEVISERGRSLPEYPVRGEERPGLYKAYVEARRGENYSLRIRNRTSGRIGVVIAVDGRNIISGARSDLRPDERMYVLGPDREETYQGWRTGRNRINRFYFTDAGDSYAGAWGDYSAMGVIAVAAFREVRSTWEQSGPGFNNQRGMRVPPADAAESRSAAPSAESEPGTGYGEGRWSPSRRVEFDPERRAFAQLFLKYAWRETLCREGIASCETPARPPRNRFWSEDNEQFTPPPPRRPRDNGEDWR